MTNLFQYLHRYKNTKTSIEYWIMSPPQETDTGVKLNVRYWNNKYRTFMGNLEQIEVNEKDFPHWVEVKDD